MAITYPLNIPTSRQPANVQIRALNATAFSESPFTFKQQVLEHQGQRWEMSLNFDLMNSTDAAEWEAWLLSLKGNVGTFLMGDPVRTAPLGSAGGTPVVNGASQTGESLVLDGATASQTGWLQAGDYIQLGTGSSTHLHRVLQDADSDVSGNVTLDIWPKLRESPADGATITTSSTKGHWRLNANSISWDIRSAGLYTFSFSALEVL